MRRYHVETVCTTDDPVDSLEYHIKTRESGFEIKMLPTWRPDKTMAVEVPSDFRTYMEKLSAVSGVTISSFDDMVSALHKRHDFFAEQGCKLSDHGIEEFYAENYTDAEIKTIFNKVYSGQVLTKEEILKFKSAMLVILGEMDWEKGWTQQFHYGAIRNNNTKMFKLLGPDTGFDSIGEFTTAKAMAKFLDRLNMEGKLTKTILYNLNPCANEVYGREFPRWNYSGQNSVWFRMVVPRPERWYGKADKCIIIIRTIKSFCRYVDRFTFFPILPSS